MLSSSQLGKLVTGCATPPLMLAVADVRFQVLLPPVDPAKKIALVCAGEGLFSVLVHAVKSNAQTRIDQHVIFILLNFQNDKRLTDNVDKKYAPCF